MLEIEKICSNGVFNNYLYMLEIFNVTWHNLIRYYETTNFLSSKKKCKVIKKEMKYY